MPWQPLWATPLRDDPASNVTDGNCSNGVQWIYKALNDCVYDGQGIASEVLGLASILTWMIVSIPQMVKNCRNIRGIEGISLLLILMWTLGDSSNLVGAILTKQLPLQIYLAIYFVFADLILFGQFLYYNLWWKRRYEGYETIVSTGDPATPTQAVMCLAGILMFSFHGSLRILESYNTFQAAMSYRQSDSIRHPTSRSLLSSDSSQNRLGYHVHIFNNLEDELGYAIGIVSSLFYVGSRTGQMYKNYKRQSTDGLSFMMFLLAVLGNVTYGFSILVRNLDGNYVLKHLPWLVGSLGVVFLDLALLLQFRHYRNKENGTLIKPPVDSEIHVTVHQGQTGSINS